MTALTLYERARAALAECRTVDEVLSVRDSAERLKLYARQAKDRELMAGAAEIQMKAERKLGFVLKDARQAGQIIEGRRTKASENCSPSEQFPRVTLDEIGVDRKLSSIAQKRADMPESAFEATVALARDRILSDRAKIIDDGPINGARALMGSRVEPNKSHDHFPTPPWATRALIEHAFAALPEVPMRSVWEPACGEGHMAEVLRESCDDIFATDIHDYGYGGVLDFLSDEALDHKREWIITNPPFNKKTEQFVLRALDLATVGVAVFVRLQWLETIGRYERLFRQRPPTLISFFCERVPLCKGRWNPDGDTATAYIWLVWVKDALSYATRAVWIPPGCREKLERPGDRERFTAHPVIRKEKEPAKVIEKPVAKPPLGEIEIPEAIRRVGL